MVESTRLLLAFAGGFTSSFLLAFLVAPDPTGIVPLLLGAVGTAVLVPLLYFVVLPRVDGLGDEADPSSEHSE